MMREGLTRLLTDRQHEVCAAVADGAALLAAVAEHRPDVAVVDIRGPPTHSDEGLRAALELRNRYPGTGVLVFSPYIETRYTSQLLAGPPLACATCSRTGSPSWLNSPIRWPASRPAAPHSTRRSSARCCLPGGRAWPR